MGGVGFGFEPVGHVRVQEGVGRVRGRVKVRVRARVRCCALPMVSSHGGARSPVAAPGDMGEIWGRYIGEI